MIVYVWPPKNSTRITIALVSCILSACIITELNDIRYMPYFLLYSLNPVHCDHPSLAAMYSLSKLLPFIYQKERLQCKTIQGILSSHPTNGRLWGGIKDELP